MDHLIHMIRSEKNVMQFISPKCFRRGNNTFKNKILRNMNTIQNILIIVIKQMAKMHAGEGGLLSIVKYSSC